MREGDLLDHIYRRTPKDLPRTLVGPGDDCAVIDLGGARPALIATDQLVGGRHFDPMATPIDRIARKVVARNVSDIAAMAGEPTHALCAATLPTGYPHADELFDAVRAWGEKLGCPLVGGDIATSDGPLVLSVTIVGLCHPTRGAVLRSGARAGDGVFVSGPLGDTLDSGWHLDFEPRTALAQRLATDLGERLHAMIDLSDGLGRDGGRVARASGVRLEIEAGAIPLREGARGWSEAVRGGEDYELLVVADATAIDGLVRIGRVVEGEGCVVIDDDGALDVASEGWEHA